MMKQSAPKIQWPTKIAMIGLWFLVSAAAWAQETASPAPKAPAGPITTYAAIDLGFSPKWNLMFLSAEFVGLDLVSVSLDVSLNPIAYFFLDAMNNDESKKSDYSAWIGRLFGIGSSQYLRFGPISVLHRLMITDNLFTLNVGMRLDLDKKYTLQIYYPYYQYDLYTKRDFDFEYDTWYTKTFKFKLGFVFGIVVQS